MDPNNTNANPMWHFSPYGLYPPYSAAQYPGFQPYNPYGYYNYVDPAYSYQAMPLQYPIMGNYYESKNLQSECYVPTVAKQTEKADEFPPLPPGPPPNPPPPPPQLQSDSNTLIKEHQCINSQLQKTFLDNETGNSLHENQLSVFMQSQKKKKRKKKLRQLQTNFSINNSVNNEDLPVIGNSFNKSGSSSSLLNNDNSNINLSSLTQPSDWPESLKNYINRCFSSCTKSVDKDKIEIILKGKLTQAISDGKLWTKNWDDEPLPSFLSCLESPTSSSMIPYDSPVKLQFTISKRPSLNRFRGFGRNLFTRSHSVSSSDSDRSSHSNSDGSSKYKDKKLKDNSDDSDSVKQIGGKAKQRLGIKINIQKKKKMRKKNLTDSCPFYNLMPTMTVDDEFGTTEKLQKRAARFNSIDNGRKKKSLNINESVASVRIIEDLEMIDWSSYHIIGTCMTLEKSYLRLTTAPDPSTVRPFEVLKLALPMVYNNWKQKQDYPYACDQLKSLRQDLTVQGIRNEFTVLVYESHARIALESGDREEFNQCQAQLQALYHDVGGDHRLEFTAYRIIYCIFTKNTLDLNTILASLSKDEKQEMCISYALKLLSAWALANYHIFFKLYLQAPEMSAFLIDWFLNRERRLALKIMIKSFRQHLPINYVQKELAFPNMQDCLKFLNEFCLIYTDDQHTSIDCKSSSGILQYL